MKIAVYLAFGVLGMFLAAPAQALTISNIDGEAHTVTVKTGADSNELAIEPEKTVEAPCASGCTVELKNGEVYEMRGNEEASIEGGTLFVDGVAGGAD